MFIALWILEGVEPYYPGRSEVLCTPKNVRYRIIYAWRCQVDMGCVVLMPNGKKQGGGGGMKWYGYSLRSDMGEPGWYYEHLTAIYDAFDAIKLTSIDIVKWLCCFGDMGVFVHQASVIILK